MDIFFFFIFMKAYCSKKLNKYGKNGAMKKTHPHLIRGEDLYKLYKPSKNTNIFIKKHLTVDLL